MSTEVVSSGNDFLIIHDDRAFGGVRTEAFKVNGATGAVTARGQALSGTQNIAGSLVATGDITAGDDLVVTDDASIGGDLVVTGTLAVTSTSVFTGAVTLPAATVTAAQLALALAAKIPGTPTLTVGALVGDGRAVTIQLKDVGGVNMSGVQRARVWLSDTSKGTPVDQVTTGLTTSFTTGTVAYTKLANMDFDVLSDTSGVIVIVVTDTNGTQTRYVQAEVAGIVTASAAVVTT